MATIQDTIEKEKITETSTVRAGTTETLTKTPGIIDAAIVESETEKPQTKKKTTPETTVTEKKKAKATTIPPEAESETKLRRPPMEQLASDINNMILEKSIGGHKIKSLGYKLGKNIYGLPNPSGSGKEFRIIATKARKKTKTVEGKSRCIYYFGISEDHSHILKEIPAAANTKFGQCAVQVKRPIMLVIDKTTFAENFEQNEAKIREAVEKLVDYTITQKQTEYDSLLKSQKEKKEAAEKEASKTSKESKTSTSKKTHTKIE